MMIKKVKELIEQYHMIVSGDEIIAGVSGGADSVCMFFQLVEYRKQVDFVLKVVHINHLIRDDAADDAEFVKNLCKDNNVEFFLFEEDVESQAKELGLSSEEAGRRIRYKRFNEVMDSSFGKIAVAHNRNDVAETTLFNIFRGTGVEGLASLLPVNGNIIRPIIGINRDDIEAYLKGISQAYKTDSTNATNDYSRNKIRNVILPYAEQNLVNGATNHVAELSDKMCLVRTYIEKQIDLAYKDVEEFDDAIVINLERFNIYDELIKQELILRVLDKLTSGRKDIGQVHVKAIISITAKQGEKKIDLPYNIEALKQYEKLIVRKKVESYADLVEYNLADNSSIELEDKRCIKTRVFSYESSMAIPQNTYTKWFDYDKIIECLKVRTRRPKDYLTVNNKLQKKSIKEYMIDRKIPKEMRDKQLLVADGNHVLWVIGYRISEEYKVTESTKRVIEISIV